MKKTHFYLAVFLSAVLFTLNNVNAQVTVSGSTGANGDYTSLTQAGGAFSVINGAGSQSGNNISITITADVATEDGANSLNAGDWKTLTISPGGGAARTISGSVIGHLIILDGADNVTIDGLNAGGNSLTISNAGVGASSTIRFINDASANAIFRCTLNGSTTSFGVIFFSTGTTTGNDDNVINTCQIGPAGVNLPLNGIYSLGTSAVIDNSGETISGNNIADAFNAGLQYNGMNINTGSSGWIISNNRIYQTAARTVTTANTDNGIFITSGSAYNISDNIIGYATSTATGVMTLNSTVALRFVGINCAFTAGGTTSNIQGNTIASISTTTSSNASTANGILCGINVTSGNANIGTITSNTIGATTGTGSLTATSTTTSGLLVGINSSTTGAMSIQNNSIGAFSCSGTTAAVAGSVAGIIVSGISSSMTISNNTIGNTTADNMRGGTLGLTTGSSLVSGINMPSTSLGVITVSGNTIRNLSSFGSGTTAFVRGIWTAAASGSASTYNIYSNTITALTSNSALTTITNGQAGTVGINPGTGNNNNIYLNTISNLANINTGTTATFVAGIISANATNSSIYRNRIYDLRNAGTSVSATAPSQIAGIIIRSGTTAVFVYNNMISLGNGQTTNSAISGIQFNHGSTPDPIDNVLYNSINIEGTVSAGAQPSFGIYRGDYSATVRAQTVNIKNNILTNSRTGGTGKHYAIANNYGAATSATGWASNASNYNVLNGNAATIGYWTTDQTFDGWKTASASDGSSFSGIAVTFVNTVTGDLHLNMGVTPTVLESNGTVISGITTDYDNDVRPGPAGSVNGGAFAPDLGADEFDGVYLDGTGPAISYALLTNTNSTSNRSFTPVTITDISGVNGTSGTSPRVYYKKRAEANVLASWKFTESTGSSPFSFTINYSLLTAGSVSIGDTIQYFVVAQDLASIPNVGIYLGAFASTPSSVALGAGAFPIGGTINSYIITDAPLSGDYTVGSMAFNRYTGKNITFNRVVTKVMKEVYETIENENSTDRSQAIDNTLLNANNVRKVMKEVEEESFIPMEDGKIYDGPLYVKRTEDPNLPSDAGVGTYATITAAINDLSLRGVSGPVRFLLKDATYTTGTGEIFPITLNAYTGASSVNTLTIQADSAASTISGTSATALLKLNGADYVTVDGVNSGGKSLTFTNSSTAGVNVWLGSANSSNGATNNTMKNLTLTGPSIAGILASSGTVLGNDSEAPNSDNTITGCTTKGTQNGFYVRGNATNLDQNWTITQNNCGSTVISEKHTFRGMGIIYSQNFNASNNYIAGLQSTATSTATTQGIGLFLGINGGTINANKIGDVYQQNTTGYGAAGIVLSAATTASGVTVSNNFIWDVRAYGFNGVLSSDNGYGIMVNTGGGYNIYYNTVAMAVNQTTVGGNSAAINISSALITANSLDIRDNIFSNVQTVGANRWAVYSGAAATVYTDINYNDYYYGTAPNLGFLGANQADLAAWKIATGKDANSSSVLANFVNQSTGDLHLTGASIGDLNLLGTPIAGITTDIDGNTRGTVKPYMGADEATALSGLTLKLNWEACPNAGAVTVELRSGSSPYGLIESANGTGGGNIASVINFGNAADATPYYVVVKSANSVETWSASTVTFTAHAASYDFTSAISQAYGSNQKLSGGIPSIYQGDANQDGFVNTADVLATYNNASAFITAPNTDFNCDGTTDLTDVVLAFNNSTNFIQKQRP